MNVSFGMTSSPFYYMNKLAENPEAQYVNAKSVNEILDDLKVNLMMEINYAQEAIAKQTNCESINKIPADILRSLACIDSPKNQTPTANPNPEQHKEKP